MFPSKDLTRLQREQHLHDMRNHFEIVCLHKTDRLKHYGLHFAKYVGRISRESLEPKPIERTLVDTLLVSLSAANTLDQNLGEESYSIPSFPAQIDPLRVLADAAGRFADACEKIDHMEEFGALARHANRDIAEWILVNAEERGLELDSAIKARRQELSLRHFYVSD